MIVIRIYNNFLNYRQKWYFIDNKVNFKCYLQLISLKKSIQSKHHLQFPSIKKKHLISIKNISFQLKNNSFR